MADRSDSTAGKHNCDKIEDINDTEASFLGDEIHQGMAECNFCPETFFNQHALIKHLLKCHCVYSGLICPYCRDTHHPQRFIDLQAHVTKAHMDKLTGYGVSNECKLCKKSFTGYAELRDHVQIHGDMFREPAPNKELYKENARRRRREKRIVKLKQRELSSKKHIFQAAKDISDNIYKSKFTILRKVTNEELVANHIQRLDTGKLLIEDKSLLSKSLIHFDNENGSKQLMIPVNLGHPDTHAQSKSPEKIDLENIGSPSSTTRQINFEDGIVQSDFGVVRSEVSYNDTVDVTPHKKEEFLLKNIQPSSQIKGFQSVMDTLISGNFTKTNMYDHPPPPPPNSPPEEENLEQILTMVSQPRSPIKDEMQDEDQGTNGIIITNNQSTFQNVLNSNDKGIRTSAHAETLSGKTNLRQNALIANVLRAIRTIKEDSQYNDVARYMKAGYGITIHLKDKNVRGSRKSDVQNYANLLRATKRDFAVPNARNVDTPEEMGSRQVRRNDMIKSSANDDDEVNLSGNFDENAHSSSSQATASEKFQQISSPFSVAALLAAAELDEELDTSGDGQE